MFNTIRIHSKSSSLGILQIFKSVLLIGTSLNPAFCSPLNHPHRSWEGAQNIQFEFALPQLHNEDTGFDHYNMMLNIPSVPPCGDVDILRSEQDLDFLPGGALPLEASHDVRMGHQEYNNRHGNMYASMISHIEEYPQVFDLFQNTGEEIHDQFPSAVTLVPKITSGQESKRDLDLSSEPRSYVGPNPTLVELVKYQNMNQEGARDDNSRSFLQHIPEESNGFKNREVYSIFPSRYHQSHKDQVVSDKSQTQYSLLSGDTISSDYSPDHINPFLNAQSHNLAFNPLDSSVISARRQVFYETNPSKRDNIKIDCFPSTGTSPTQTAKVQEKPKYCCGIQSDTSSPSAFTLGGRFSIPIHTLLYENPSLDTKSECPKVFKNDFEAVKDCATPILKPSHLLIEDCETINHDRIEKGVRNNSSGESEWKAVNKIQFNLIKNVGCMHLKVTKENTDLADTEDINRFCQFKMLRFLRSQGKSFVENTKTISKSIEEYFNSAKEVVDQVSSDDVPSISEIRQRIKGAIESVKSDVVMVLLGSLRMMCHTESHTMDSKSTLEEGWLFLKVCLQGWFEDSIPVLMDKMIVSDQDTCIWSQNIHLSHYLLHLSNLSVTKLSFNWALMEKWYEFHPSQTVRSTGSVDWKGFSNVCTKIHDSQRKNGTLYKAIKKNVSQKPNLDRAPKHPRPSEPLAIERVEDEFNQDLIYVRIRTFLIKEGNFQIQKERSICTSISWFTRSLTNKLESYINPSFPHLTGVSDVGIPNSSNISKSDQFYKHEKSIKNAMKLVSQAIIPGFMGILTVVSRYQGTYDYISVVLEHGWGFLKRYLQQWGELNMTVREIESLFSGELECHSNSGVSWLDCKFALQYALKPRKKAHLPYTGVFFLTQKWYDSFTEQKKLGEIKTSLNILPFKKSHLEEVFWRKHARRPTRRREENDIECSKKRGKST